MIQIHLLQYNNLVITCHCPQYQVSGIGRLPCTPTLVDYLVVIKHCHGQKRGTQ